MIGPQTTEQHAATLAWLRASLMLSPKRCDRQFEASRKGAKP